MANNEQEMTQACARAVGAYIWRRPGRYGYGLTSEWIVQEEPGGKILARGSWDLVSDWFWRHRGDRVRDKIDLMLPPSVAVEFDPSRNFVRELRASRAECERLRREMERQPRISEDFFRSEMKRAEEEKVEQDRQRSKSSDEMNRKITEAVEEYREKTGEKPNLFRLYWWNRYEVGKGFLKSEPTIKEIGFD